MAWSIKASSSKNINTLLNKNKFMQNHEIDYQIFGEEMQYVVVELDPDEMVIAEAGAMMFMTSDIKRKADQVSSAPSPSRRFSIAV